MLAPLILRVLRVMAALRFAPPLGDSALGRPAAKLGGGPALAALSPLLRAYSGNVSSTPCT